MLAHAIRSFSIHLTIPTAEEGTEDKQCSRWVSEKRLHEDSGFRLTKRGCRMEEETGAQLCVMLCTQIGDAIVPDGWHTIVGALVQFAGIFLPLPFYRTYNKNVRLLVPLLARHGRYPPRHDNSDVNQSINVRLPTWHPHCLQYMRTKESINEYPPTRALPKQSSNQCTCSHQ
jgi:hypothetical protein